MSTPAQKALLDALSQHQAYLYRASSQSVNELLKQFGSISNAQLLRLSELLEELTDTERKALQGLNFSGKGRASKRIEEIKASLNEWFDSLSVELSADFEKSAITLAVYEAAYAVKLFGEAAVAISGAEAYETIRKTPYAGGQLVDHLFKDIAASLRKKVEYVIRDGISQGQTNQQIVQRIKGKREKVDGGYSYTGGMLEAERHVIERQVRTARSHVSTSIYIDTYKAAGYEYVKVVATLDGRTCKYCASIDGDIYSIDDPARPRFPVHPNNRTTYVGCDKDGNIAGQRPFVMDERKVKDIPKEERKHLIGQLDANTSVGESKV